MPRTTQKAGVGSPAPVQTPDPETAPQLRRRVKHKQQGKAVDAALLKYATSRKISLADAKAELDEVKHPEVVRRVQREFDASAGVVGQDRPRDMPSTGPARIDPGVVEPVEGPRAMAHAEALIFMEEKVTVVVHDTPDPNADPFPKVGVNGVNQYFIRGEQQTVRRKFVERLARAKSRRYKQSEYTDANGARAIRNTPITSLMYPFSVIHDPNPNGRAWLEKILQEA